MKKNNVIYIIVFLTLFNVSFSQNIGINSTGAYAHPSALLDIDASPSNNTGLLIPRIPLTAINAAAPVTSPATSLLVYNTATASSGTNAVSPGYYHWDGVKWVRFAYTANGSSSTAWDLIGNFGTNPATNFLGTTDAQDLVFRTNNTEKMRVLSNGNVGIGTSFPNTRLDVIGNSTTTAIYAKNGSTITSLLGLGASNAFSYIDFYNASGTKISNIAFDNTNNYLLINALTPTINTIMNPLGGNVGINNLAPQNKLSIYTPTIGTGLQLQDGSEGLDKVLVSDANGKAHWSSSYTFPFCVIKAPTITQSVTPNVGFTFNGAWWVDANSFSPTPSVSSSGVITGLAAGVYQVLYNYDIGGNEYYWTYFDSYNASNVLIDSQATLQPEWPSGAGVITVASGGHVDIKFASNFKYVPTTTNLMYGWDTPQNQTFQLGKFTFIKLQ